ncbi:hypothetical protein [Natronosalvus amylolyticus]|uniref:hypothetical protein n=1 Tax=Natronosalvus amylolyticus TaxID=2961994 RepID=UPI0020C9B03B|nr:hypothetical protein [Natronosalvus amylolyticus]
MTTQPKAGELLVGAYLRVVKECELVMYNQRSSRQGDQLEIDVIGVTDTEDGDQEVYICEVTTHLGGLRYGTYQESYDNLRKKFRNDRDYITEIFDSADTYKFQLWSPVVPFGLEKRLPELDTVFEGIDNMELELVINEDYSNRIDTLQVKASSTKKQFGELGFRLLQILEHTK